MSSRTLSKAGIERAKMAGVPLGSHRAGHWDGVVVSGKHKGASRADARRRGAEAGAKKSAVVRHDLAVQHHASVVVEAARLRAAGSSWAAVAEELNAAGFTTRRGNAWNAARIHEVMKTFADGGNK